MIAVYRFSIWIEDIEPKGFRTLSMDGYVTNELADCVKALHSDKKAPAKMSGRNYQLANRYFSYKVLRRRLRTLILNVTGLD